MPTPSRSSLSTAFFNQKIRLFRYPQPLIRASLPPSRKEADMDRDGLIAALEADGSAKALVWARWLREWVAPTVH